MRSWLLGTTGLWMVLAVSVGLSWTRPFAPLERTGRRRLLVAGSVAILAQAAHFLEELATGFPRRFPEVLGLDPWSGGPFAAFNVTWLCLWVASLWAAAAGRRWAEWPIWFLAVALVANAVAHPLLALAGRAYFPGLVTAVAAGAVGLWLLATLGDLSDRARRGREG
ncbi:MAG: HXXEE domain-containing protein [Gemmatimonadota bacterium]|jgi:hypothetical protein